MHWWFIYVTMKQSIVSRQGNFLFFVILQLGLFQLLRCADHHLKNVYTFVEYMYCFVEYSVLTM